MDESALIERLEKSYAHHREECQERFLTRNRAIAVLWTIVVVMLGVFGSSVAWALATTSSLSKLETLSTAQDTEIRNIKSTYSEIDKKLDRILLMRQP